MIRTTSPVRQAEQQHGKEATGADDDDCASETFLEKGELCREFLSGDAIVAA
jgi:hypothetical protein